MPMPGQIVWTMASLRSAGSHLRETVWKLASPLPRSQPSAPTGRRFSLARHTSWQEEDDEDPILSLPPTYLRAIDASNYDPQTRQRTDVVFDLRNGKPASRGLATKNGDTMKSFRVDKGNRYYRVQWEDGSASEYPVDLIYEWVRRWKGDSSTDRVLWTGLTAEKLRSSKELCMSFEYVLSSEGMQLALRSLFRYGLLQITNTPTDDSGAGIAVLAAAVGGGSIKNSSSLLPIYQEGRRVISLPHGTDGPLRTVWGTVWSTCLAGQAEGASVADSAYGRDALPLHNDMCYHRDPPGLQIFTMAQQALRGGESIFSDGFAAADRLKRMDPEAFHTLSSVVRRYQSVDMETGWHMEASGPVISVANGQVVAIRHNDLDRLPDLPPADLPDHKFDLFYGKLERAHQLWDHILSDDDMRLVINLDKGDTVVVANQRCMHGRYSFECSSSEPRTVMGCYVSQDELNSRFRVEGYEVF